MIPIIILIAGLIAWLATSYDTVGIILTIIGGALVAVQAIFLLIAAVFATKVTREVNRSIFDDRRLR